MYKYSLFWLDHPHEVIFDRLHQAFEQRTAQSAQCHSQGDFPHSVLETIASPKVNYTVAELNCISEWKRLFAFVY